MRQVQDENGKTWDIESAGTLAERNRVGHANGRRYEEAQKLMHTPEGEFFIYTTGKNFDAADGGVGQPYENAKPLSSEEAVRELEGGKDWKRTG